MQVNHPLVDPHFVSVPGLGPLPTWSLTGGDLEYLSRHTNRPFDLQFRVTGTPYEIVTDYRVYV